MFGKYWKHSYEELWLAELDCVLADERAALQALAGLVRAIEQPSRDPGMKTALADAHAVLYPKRDPTKLYRCGLEMSARQTSRP